MNMSDEATERRSDEGKSGRPRLLAFPFVAPSLRRLTTMDPLALQHYLAVGAILFGIGLIGFMTRRNLIVMFLCTELMFQGVAINMIAFGRYWGNFSGQAFTIFVLVIAAAEASLALGLVVLLFRQKNTL